MGSSTTDVDDDGLGSPGAPSVEQLQAAGDPISCRDLFWQSLAQGNRDIATEAESRLDVPPVEEQSLISKVSVQKSRAGMLSEVRWTIGQPRSSQILCRQTSQVGIRQRR